ncbi:hypothetical protein KO465_03800 [Candidatus Micrarchaeota archaeon]|nr:hypothetical protein [Candidatus Micrarchaeota archaeon]
MRIIAFKALGDALKVAVNFPLETLKAAFLFFLAVSLLISAGLTPALVVFYAITAINMWTSITSFILVSMLLISYVVVWFFISSYTAAFVKTLFDLFKERKRPSLFTYIQLGLKYGRTYFAYAVIKNFILLVILIPLLGITYYFNVLNYLPLIFLPIFVLFWFLTMFVPISIVVDEAHSLTAIKKGIKFIFKKPLDSIIIFTMITIPFVLLFLVPIIGNILQMLIILPLSWLALLLTYYYGR